MKFSWRDVYGRRLFYPADAQAETLCAIVGRRSLTAKQLHQLRSLGATLAFSVELEASEMPAEAL